MSCVKPKMSLKKLDNRVKELEKKVKELSELVQTQTKGKKRGPKKSETETITSIKLIKMAKTLKDGVPSCHVKLSTQNRESEIKLSLPEIDMILEHLKTNKFYQLPTSHFMLT